MGLEKRKPVILRYIPDRSLVSGNTYLFLFEDKELVVPVHHLILPYDIVGRIIADLDISDTGHFIVLKLFRDTLGQEASF